MTAGFLPFKVVSTKWEIGVVGGADRERVLSLDTDPARSGVSNTVLIEKGMRVDEPGPASDISSPRENAPRRLSRSSSNRLLQGGCAGFRHVPLFTLAEGKEQRPVGDGNVF
jgi:hypothetical protein